MFPNGDVPEAFSKAPSNVRLRSTKALPARPDQRVQSENERRKQKKEKASQRMTAVTRRWFRCATSAARTFKFPRLVATGGAPSISKMCRVSGFKFVKINEEETKSPFVSSFKKRENAYFPR